MYLIIVLYFLFIFLFILQSPSIYLLISYLYYVYPCLFFCQSMSIIASLFNLQNFSLSFHPNPSLAHCLFLYLSFLPLPLSSPTLFLSICIQYVYLSIYLCTSLSICVSASTFAYLFLPQHPQFIADILKWRASTTENHEILTLLNSKGTVATSLTCAQLHKKAERVSEWIDG